MKKALMSIIIPVHNSELYLDRLFQSLINQTSQEFEIVIVDDGSVDGSALCINNYKDIFKDRLIYIFQENRGVAAARNRGLHAACGEYIAFVDSDDYLYDNYCEKMLALISDADIAVCGVTVHYKNEIYEHHHVNQSFRETGLELAKDSLKKKNVAHVLWCKLFRRSIFNGFEFIEGKIFEDMYGCAILPLSAKSVVYTDEELYVYCRRDDSLSTSITESHAYDLTYLLQQIAEVYKEAGILNNMLEELQMCTSGLIELFSKWYIRNSLTETVFRNSVSELLAFNKKLRRLSLPI